MELSPSKYMPALSLVALSALAVACSDGGPAEPDINPGLLDSSLSTGLAAGGSLPQGAGRFEGPGGLVMDATAEEFIQQLSFDDGTVWKTSGVSMRAVPDEALSGSPITALSFGAAHTGSLASVRPGTFQVAGLPDFDFITPKQFGYAGVRLPGQRATTYAMSGSVTISSLNYFDDVYTCELDIKSVWVAECSYRLGVVQGVTEFRVTTPDGSEIVQDRTEFALPIMRRTIIMRMK